MNKPIFKKWWFWVLIILILGAIGKMGGNNQEAKPVQDTSATAQKEPTEEEWQASYKKIALGEASAFLELTLKNTITPERIESAVKVLRSQAEKITGDDKKKYQDLADLIEAKDFEKTKELYLSLGGDESILSK